jgi:hypothetical protein
LLISSLVSLPPETVRLIVEARAEPSCGGGSAFERGVALVVLAMTVAMATLAGLALG